MPDFNTVAGYASGIAVICTTALLFIKPLRKWFFKDKEQRDGIKCLLRSQMLVTYYHNKDAEKIRQYEYENFIACYGAYKAMGGNSFIDHIKEEVDSYEVVT